MNSDTSGGEVSEPKIRTASLLLTAKGSVVRGDLTQLPRSPTNRC